MKCECGSTKHLSKHIPTQGGWITLTNPTCHECREKMMQENGDAFNSLQQLAMERAKTTNEERINNG